jgi:lysophospholipase L1-like esterase
MIMPDVRTNAARTNTARASTAWTTAYLAALASPEDVLDFLPPSRSFSAQTVRQAVRLRRGGAAVRFLLSNEFGRAPLVIDEVAIAVGDGQGVHAVLRDGRARWEIPPGRTAVSDPVSLTVAAGEELLVSTHIAGRTEPATYLHSAQRTGEVAPGHQLGQSRLTEAEQFTSLYWLAQVLVDEPARGPVVAAFGDSITRGDATSVDRDQRYPDHLQRRLQESGVEGGVVLNAGIGASRVLRPRVGPAMTDRFDRDVLALADVTHVVIMGGIGDIMLPSVLGQPRPTADDLVGGLFRLARRAKEHGIQPTLGTMTPLGNYEFSRTEGNEDIRQAVNRAIRSQPEWPVTDFAASVADPASPTRLIPAFDSGDGLHPADDGARALADAVDLNLFT